MRYAVVTHSHPTLSCLLELTNDLINEQGRMEFNATLLVVARWIDACSIDDGNCVEVRALCHQLRTLLVHN